MKVDVVSLLSRLFVSVAAATAFAAQAADQGFQLQQSSNFVSSVESPADVGFTLWDRFEPAFYRNANDLFADHFHPFNRMARNFDLADSGPEDFRLRTTATAKGALSKSAVYGARQATIELPIMLWLKEHQGFLADLLRNSVASVEEESLAPLNVSYRRAERVWWQHVSESGEVRYGVRPFRTDPYAFLSLGIWDGDRVFLLGNVRYHYLHFSDHRFELSLSVPLMHGLSIDVGTSYEFGRHDEQKRFALKLLKESKGGSVLHVGLEMQQHPTLFAGMTIPL